MLIPPVHLSPCGSQLISPRCAWLYCVNNVLLSLSGSGGQAGGGACALPTHLRSLSPAPPSHSPPPAGKSTHIWAHDLPGLFEQRRLQQQVPLSIPTNRLTQRIIPRSGTLGSLALRGWGRGRRRGRPSPTRAAVWPACPETVVTLALPRPGFLICQDPWWPPLSLPLGLLGGKETMDVKVPSRLLGCGG